VKRQNHLSSFVRRQTTERVKKEAKKLQEISVVIVLEFYCAHFPSFIGIQLLVIFSKLYSTIKYRFRNILSLPLSFGFVIAW